MQQENINSLLDDMRQNGENMDAATVDRRRMEAPMLEMELDRVKFVLASYLRSRLKKLDQNIMYALSTPAVVERLSEAEMQYAAGYVDMLGDAFQKSFLDHLPPQFQSLTEKEMIDAPDLDKFVAFRVKEHIGDYVCTDQYEIFSSLSNALLICITCFSESHSLAFVFTILRAEMAKQSK
jgi:hypothetical protein